MPPADPDPDARPRLRPGVRTAPGGPAGLVLHDARRLSPSLLTLSPAAARLIDGFNGSATVREVWQAATTAGLRVTLGQVRELVAALDDALFLDGPTFAAYLAGPVRRPSCIGCYPPDPDAIRPQLDALFTAPGGPGLPSPAGPPGPATRPPLRAVLLPHMDYARGGVTYGWGFRELADRTDARLFVIVATSHYSPERFTLSRMHFETPLGVAETDRAFVDRVADAYGPDAFADPYAHLPEHSVELEVVLLQHLFVGRGGVRIVPLLVGSFADHVARGTDPAGDADLMRMAAALRAAEAAAGEPVCYLVSGDLAHIGPKFGDPDPVGGPHLLASRRRDDGLLDRLAAADHAGFFAAVAAEGDGRRICGLSPLWVALEAARPRTGQVLHYQQYAHTQGHESVSFAAAAFYG